MINRILAAAAELQRFCDAQGWRSCLIGGIAVQVWSQPRVTLDVDLTLLTGFGPEADFIDVLLSKYRPRLSDPQKFALKSRVLLIETEEAIGIDVSLGALPYEELVVSRAVPYSFGPGIDVRVCTPEDLIVLKLFAFRPLDLRDAEGVVIRHRDRLDWNYIVEQLTPLADAKEQPEILDALQRLRKLRV